MTIH
jgi:Ca2+-binding EF-hand superfamily protein